MQEGKNIVIEGSKKKNKQTKKKKQLKVSIYIYIYTHTHTQDLNTKKQQPTKHKLLWALKHIKQNNLLVTLDLSQRIWFLNPSPTDWSESWRIVFSCRMEMKR